MIGEGATPRAIEKQAPSRPHPSSSSPSSPSHTQRHDTAAAADPAAGDNLILNFSLPAASIYRNKPVASVVIPVRAWCCFMPELLCVLWCGVYASLDSLPRWLDPSGNGNGTGMSTHLMMVGA
jgi:hypothetical protein